MSGRSFWQAAVNISEGAARFHSPQKITSPYDDNALELTLFVPCRDAAVTIKPTLATIAEAMTAIGKTYEIIVIDDDSKDHTVEVVREFIFQNRGLNVVLLHNHKPAGLYDNFLSAAFIGRGKYFRQINSDNSESARQMIDILRAMGDADIVVPSSMAEIGENRGKVSAMSRLLNMLLTARLSEYNGRPVHLRYNLLRWQPDTRGPAFPTAILCHLIELGFTYRQVPCRMQEKPFPLTGRDWLSLVHAVMEILIRRISRRFM